MQAVQAEILGLERHVQHSRYLCEACHGWTKFVLQRESLKLELLLRWRKDV